MYQPFVIIIITIVDICTESTPVGRLIQRFSKDIDQVDQQLPGSIAQLVASSLNIAGALFTITMATPSFSLVMLPILVLYIRIVSFYRVVARELKRLDSISRSPIYQQFGETLAGLQVIRAFKRNRLKLQNFYIILEDNFAVNYLLKSMDRWLSLRTEIIGDLIVFFTGIINVLTLVRGSFTGISLSNALSMTNILNRFVRTSAEIESYMNSVERILYTTNNTPSEKFFIQKSNKSSTSDLPSKSLSVMPDAELLSSGWPWRGGVTFSNVHMRYRSDFDPVLKGVSLEIRPGETLGIVGRTGSGKSTLFRVLLRLSELEEGSIVIDGVDISEIGLDILRSRISIIPQDAVLFSGSVRYVLLIRDILEE
jgi:ABC-type multidrug transport system fused ATPase/permease subunit